MDLAVLLTSFLLVVPVELPDKTFVASLVLATRFRPLAVWVGVGTAFLVQTAVAVTAGGLIALLPRRPVELVAAALFAVGAFVLLRGASGADEEERREEEEFAEKVAEDAPAPTASPARAFARASAASFLVLFAAEWGDLSQLLTAGLVVRFQDPWSVFVGAAAALLLVSGLAVVLGRALLRRVRLSTVRRIGGGVCAALAALTAAAALGAQLGPLG